MFTKLIITAGLLFVVSSAVSQSKKDSLGLPGDNFDLYGAMELFKKSANPEAFEKALNTKDNEINNLDLDADGKVDYIKVVDKTENNIHSIVMQVAVSKEELQDIAVIEIEKTGNDKAHIQIVGDEELYGKNYIVEPAPEGKEALASDKGSTDDVYRDSDDKGVNEDATRTNNSNASSGGNSTTIINVWGWPSVQYVYGPSYIAWNSPWYWGYYPGWYDPWYPVYWRVYHRRVYHYHYPYYRRAYYYRSPAAHNYYYGRRASSNAVREYNRNGYYHQKQQAYRSNVEPGKRYNARPANPRSGPGVRQQRRENVQPSNNGRNGRNEQPRSEPRSSPRTNGNRERAKSEQKQSNPRQQINPQRQASPQPQRQSGGGNRGSGSAPSSPRGGGGGSQGGNRGPR